MPNLHIHTAAVRRQVLSSLLLIDTHMTQCMALPTISKTTHTEDVTNAEYHQRRVPIQQ